MDFVTAALIVTWVVLALLAFAMAGLLRQLRDVQLALRDRVVEQNRGTAVPPAVRPAGAATLAIVLVADDNCPICAELAPHLPERAAATAGDVDFVVVTATPSEKWSELAGDRVRVVADRDAFLAVDPGWRPALLAVDPDGTVLVAEPVGSVDVLDKLVEHFAGARMTSAQR